MQGFTRRNSTKLCYTPQKFQGLKLRPALDILHDFFLITPGYSTLLLISPPRKSTCYFFNNPGNSISSTPFVFSGIVQYRCINLPKTDNDGVHSASQTYRSNSIHLFWNLQKTLCLTLSYRTQEENNLPGITVLIGLFHKLISVQDIGRNMLHLHVAQQLPSLRVHVHQRVISPPNNNEAELNR